MEESQEIRELKALLYRAEQQKEDPESRIAAGYFRQLLDRRKEQDAQKEKAQ
ncbi:MAG: hypothetical protein OQL08_09035 [Gammaproteobacteria bacterium]|nr:hypothetical protein [Gammaproteobacteria bacterium]